jgi:hypothetical protein
VPISLLGCWFFQLKTILQRHNNKNSMILAQKQTERPMDQNRRFNVNPCIYSQLIFDKGVQNTQWWKDSLFNKCCWENWISTWRRLKLDSCLSPCTKINSMWIKDLNIRPESLKQLQEAVGNTLEQIATGNNFLNRTQKAQHLRETMNKWDYIKLKSLCTAKDTVIGLSDSPQNGRKSLPAAHPIRY